MLVSRSEMLVHYPNLGSAPFALAVSVMAVYLLLREPVRPMEHNRDSGGAAANVFLLHGKPVTRGCRLPFLERG